eukprot:Rmarinus@m.6093
MFAFRPALRAARSARPLRYARPVIYNNAQYIHWSPALCSEDKGADLSNKEQIVGPKKRNSFQAETSRLLEIVTHSIYKNRDVFVRELVSNASDALEKLRFAEVSGEGSVTTEAEPTISLKADKLNNTLIITDTGIGMTEEELNDSLCTIARSGTKKFVDSLSEKGQNAELDLIGQFGLGFFSVFMVADKVQVFTRSAKADSVGYAWESTGVGEYEMAEASGVSVGTKIVIHLKDDCKEFADEMTIKKVIREYSNFIRFPILVNEERVNTVEPLWRKNKSEITDDEHTEFYRFISHAFDTPMYKLHFSADTPISVRSVLYVGDTGPNLLMGPPSSHVSIYSRRVMIDPDGQHLLEPWMRFVKGVVDCDDLPLNVSRESMQSDTTMRQLGRMLSRRVIRWLQEEARKDPEGYAKNFWRHWGVCVKEGVYADSSNREDIAKLMRFGSSKQDDGSVEDVSLDDYVDRMPEGQNKIYYLNAPTRALAEQSVYFESFRHSGTEVLFVHSSTDDLVMNALQKYRGKEIVSIEMEDVDSGKSDEENKETDKEESESQHADLIAYVKLCLGERASDVKISKRLRESPALITDHGTGSHRRMMMMLQQMDSKTPIPLGPQVLEVNPSHAIFQRITALRDTDDELARAAVVQIFENAMVSAGLYDDARSILPSVQNLLDLALKHATPTADKA